MKNMKNLTLAVCLIAAATSSIAGPLKKATAVTVTLATTAWYVNHVADTTQDFTKVQLPSWAQQAPTWTQTCPFKPWDKWNKTASNTFQSLSEIAAAHLPTNDNKDTSKTSSDKEETPSLGELNGDTTISTKDMTTKDPATPDSSDND